MRASRCRASTARALCALLCAALALATAAVAALAQAEPADLTLRSGAHAGFDRLTLPLPAGTGWQLGRSAAGYLLLLDSPHGFDSGAVFQRIARRRIADLQPGNDPGALRIALACDCHATAFEDGNGLLVIDIRDGPPPPGARFEASLAPAPRAAPPSAPPPPPVIDWTDRLAPAPAAPPPGLASATPDPPLPDPAAIAREALLRQFARAAAQGMVAPRPDARHQLATAAPPDGPDPLRNLGITAETALDRAQRPPGSMLTTDAAGRPCLPDALFDLAVWADERPAAVQIAEARAGLLGEFDRPDRAQVADLVRLYLALGFGAEARATLAALPLELPEADVLVALSWLIDDGQAPEPPRFAGMTDCPGAVALWAVLADPALPPPGRLHRSAVLQAFSALPAGLRQHLGGLLAARFLAAGDLDAAQTIRSAIGRAPGAADTALVLIDAELALARGAPETAARLLEGSAMNGAPRSAEALAALAAAELAAGRVLAPAMIDDLAARSVEHRGTALGQRLAGLEARGLAGSGRFDEAFARLDRLGGGDEALAPDLLTSLVERADDAGFLLHALSRPEWQGSDAPRSLRLAMANRLLDLGMAADALQALDPGGTAPERALIARAHLALGDPQAALRTVAGDGADAAAATRARALMALGEPRAAALAFADAGLTEAAARAAFLAGDHSLMADPDTVPPPDTSPAAEGGPLARAAASIEDSRALRASIDDFLARHPEP